MTSHRSLLVAISAALLMTLVVGCGNSRRGRAGVDSGPTRPGPDTGVTVDTGVPTTNDGGVSIDTGTGTDTSTGVDTGPGGSAGDVAVEGYRRLIEANCAAAHRCRESAPEFLDVTDADFVATFGSSPSACVADFYPADGQQALRDGVNSGRILYDSASANICADGFGGQTCEAFWTDGQSTSCQNAITGTVPTGSACSIGAECVTGTCSGGTCIAE